MSWKLEEIPFKFLHFKTKLLKNILIHNDYNKYEAIYIIQYYNINIQLIMKKCFTSMLYYSMEIKE